MIATSRKTRGGITAVLNTYRELPFWQQYKVKWIETHIDKNLLIKLVYAGYGFMTFLFHVGFYDIVHIHTSEAPSVKRKYLFYKVSRWLGKQIIIHLHIGNQIDEKKDNQLYKEIFQGSDRIVVLSNVIAEKLVDIFAVKRDKIEVIYNPCKKIEKVNYTVKHKTILFAGTLNANKGYDILLRAFSLIADKYPDWKVLFAGNGEIEKAVTISNKLGIDSQVIFKGWVKDKKTIFTNASLLCLPSYAEGFPMAVLDAWSYSLPVIATPVGGLQDVLQHGVNSFIFVPGNHKDLAQQLDRLLGDEDLMRKMSEESLKLSQGLFSMESINKSFEHLYQQL